MYKVVDFMNSHPDWESLLSAAPYYLTVTRDEDYILLKYSMLGSDFHEEIVRECRGLIVRDYHDYYGAVCVPFYKFGNYGESYVPAIDWNSVSVQEKVDGSLIKMWYDGSWHISTNGTIDAYKAPVNNYGKTFGDLVEKAVDLDNLVNKFDTRYTYMFELTSLENKVVIPYEGTHLYALGCRNILTGKEESAPEGLESLGIRYPKRYHITTLSECIDYAATLDWKHEGFVVVDKNWNRVKVKGPEYLAAAHVRNNGVVTDKRLMDLILGNQLDDFLGYYPEYNERVQSLKNALIDLIFGMAIAWAEIDGKNPIDKKEFAQLVKSYPKEYSGFLFKKWDNRELTVRKFLVNLGGEKVLRYLKGV